MPPNTTASVYTAKCDFLTTMVRQLSVLHQPNMEDLPASDEHGDLPDSVLQTVYYKLSIVAKKQGNLIYSQQTLRHVAEQIDSLYWEEEEGGERGDAGAAEVLRAGVDLRNSENIDRLPASYPATADASEEDLEAYQELRARLSVASQSLASQRGKKAYYERLRNMIRPFAEPRENVQPNLVTRDGELNAELERTKILAVLLAGQLQKAGLKLGRKEDEDVEMGSEEEEEEEEKEEEDADVIRERVEGLKKLLAMG
ncbi:kinetochore complex Fta4 of Sim4 subunit, or CENP-50-domain-containing protein [Sphaerosporella brunnea]|uniref:Kinetochore complex Fta4 of Sim4 subunit, or CENP-50-domain-containing protein n=1 Tax=Sphaerosporella brunnea TaxID=1250544 RepID=A0A5J5ESN6_9PEZI|nr:kinetochore complex Fta4 of Sim4 subunit, or CENP-50-domain-containing protein [Sphaerosporella brunnea]